MKLENSSEVEVEKSSEFHDLFHPLKTPERKLNKDDSPFLDGNNEESKEKMEGVEEIKEES